MSDADFHDDPDAGVDPLEPGHVEAGIEPLDPDDEGAVLEELETEWEDEEAYSGEE